MTDDTTLLRRRAELAEAALQAIRNETVDAVVGRQRLIMLRLREAEEELRLSEARYRGIVESQTEMICRWKPDRTLSFVNDAYCRFYRRPREALIGQKVAQSVYGPDVVLVNRHLDALTSIKDPREIEYRILVGEDVYWTRWTDQAIFDKQGGCLEIQSVGRDITERVHIQDALCEANKELSEFAHVLTHNLQAPMRAVHNYVDFLLEDLADNLEGEPKACLEGLKKAIVLSSRQLEDLLKLYGIKNDITRHSVIEIGDLLEEVRSVLKLSSSHKLISARRWPLLLGERHLLKHILVNLISNGFKFNHSALKRVEVGWLPVTENRIEVFVRDNGIGIDPQYHSRIFKIFKRLHTEREYDGTGIGLAIVKKAATKMGGAVRLESTPGKGSTFYVDLPLSAATAGDGAGSTGTQPRYDSGSG